MMTRRGSLSLFLHDRRRSAGTHFFAKKKINEAIRVRRLGERAERQSHSSE